MRELLAVIGLVVVALAIAHRAEPPQPSVIVDVPDPTLAPIDDLNLNGANHA